MNNILNQYSKIELTPAERKAIETHKYFLSKEAGRDVGMAYAIAHWLVNHASKWRHERLRKDLEDQWKEIEKHKWIESEKAGTDLEIPQQWTGSRNMPSNGASGARRNPEV